MKDGRERLAFAINVIFALVSVFLLALNMVQAEAAMTNGKMLSFQVNTAGDQP